METRKHATKDAISQHADSEQMSSSEISIEQEESYPRRNTNKKIRDHFESHKSLSKQCKKRRPMHRKINKQPWTDREEAILFLAHEEYGSKWKHISKQLEGRTDNDIKNKFYSSMRKKLRKISKLVGIKNSTSHVKQIKPKILSNILNNIEREHPHLMEFLLKFDELMEINLEQKDIQIGKQLIDQITCENQKYCYKKDQKSEQQLQQRPTKLTRSKILQLEKSMGITTLNQIPKNGFRMKKNSSKNQKLLKIQDSNPCKFKEQSERDSVIEESLFHRGDSFDYNEPFELFEGVQIPEVIRSLSGSNQYSTSKWIFKSPMINLDHYSPLPSNSSFRLDFGSLQLKPIASNQSDQYDNLLMNIKGRMKNS